MAVFGATLPNIIDLHPGDPSALNDANETLFKVKLAQPGCTCETTLVPSKRVVESFGRPWTTAMLATYSTELAPIATNPKHSLHSYCKEQLQLVAEFARKIKVKLEDVFGMAMRLPDDTSREKNRALGPKLKNILGLSNKIPVPEYITTSVDESNDNNGEHDSQVKAKHFTTKTKFDFRRKDFLSKTQTQVPVQNRSHLRKLQAILQTDKKMADLLKTKKIKGMSIKSRGPYGGKDRHFAPGEALGKRLDTPYSSEDESDLPYDGNEDTP